MRQKKYLVKLLLLALSLEILCAFSALAAPPGGPPPTVATISVTEQDIVPATEYIGHVEAVQTVDLRVRVEGFIEEIKFKDGDFVQAGQVLYVIEQAGYKAKVEADRAQVDQAQAEVTRVSTHMKRLRTVRKESISEYALDNALAAELAAKANLAAAVASLDISQLDLNYTTIKAPISGRIGRTNYTRGNLVNPASGPLARIVQTNPIRVVYSISENDLIAIQKSIGDMDKEKGKLLAPQLRLASGESFDETGRVVFVDNQVDPGTVTSAIR